MAFGWKNFFRSIAKTFLGLVSAGAIGRGKTTRQAAEVGDKLVDKVLPEEKSDTATGK